MSWSELVEESGQQGGPARRLRIGTWNVEYARRQRLQAMREVLSEGSADIWVLTETHDDLQPPHCPYVVHSEPRPRNHPGLRPGSRWVSIWSRHPIAEVVVLDGADRERTVVARVEIGNGQSLLVYGTVLPWKGDRGIFNWDEHHRVIPDQCAEWRMLRERYPTSALCIAGDYNTDMGTGSYYGTKKGIAALQSGLEECQLFCATAPDRVPPGLLPCLPIDHIALPREWREMASVVAAWPADKKRLSDHSGLLVEIAGAQR